jgi:hypothetical protein
MGTFEYEITKHPLKDSGGLVYFCTDRGDCMLDQVPDGQLNGLGQVLNERGARGWELVQVFFGEGGAVAFWKRSIGADRAGEGDK